MKKAWWLLSLFPTLLKRKQRQQQFVKAQFAEQLLLIRSTNQPLYNKLIYYSTWGIVSISEVFAHLSQRELTKEERFHASALSLLYALADEMVDNMDLSKEETLAFINGKPTTNAIISWAQELLNQLKAVLSDTTYLEGAIQAQLQSSNQNTEGNIENIRRLTFQKGSTTMFLYRIIVASPISDQEKKVVLQLGYTLQLADDIIDAYDDTFESINTTANTIDLNSVKYYFNDQLEIARKLFFDVYGCNSISEKAFLNFELLFGISHLALKRFEKLDLSIFSATKIEKMKRTQFIIDMEKPSNAFYALWTTLKS